MADNLYAGKLADRQFSTDINAAVDVRSIRFTTGDEICPAKWLRGVPRRSGNKKRWQHACGFEEEPSRDLTLPTRFVRVLYFLKDDLYAKFRGTGVPGAHEYVASYSSIRSYSSQQMQTFLRRMSTEQHFYKRAVRAT